MIESGILDSLQVTRAVIEDSISTGSLILTTERAVIKEKLYSRKLILLFNQHPKLILIRRKYSEKQFVFLYYYFVDFNLSLYFFLIN